MGGTRDGTQYVHILVYSVQLLLRNALSRENFTFEMEYSKIHDVIRDSSQHFQGFVLET